MVAYLRAYGTKQSQEKVERELRCYETTRPIALYRNLPSDCYQSTTGAATTSTVFVLIWSIRLSTHLHCVDMRSNC